MKTKIFCRTTGKGRQTFYVKVNGKEYFLFEQEFRRSNKNYFQNGVSINVINNYASIHSESVRRTLDKLPSYLHYIEKEYNLAIYENTKKKIERKRNKPYKREQFRLQDYMWEVA